MASNNECDKTSQCSGTDIVSSALRKVGLCRSTLITLALIPFSWEGVRWFANAVTTLWDFLQGVTQ